jgi:hypothetical protein
MHSRKPAVFLVAVLVLAGACLMRGTGLLLGAIAVACAIAGGMRALADNHLRNPYLRWFAWLYCIGIVYVGGVVGWQPLTLDITMGSDALRLGPNFVGFALLSWYYAVARNARPLVAANVEDTAAAPAATERPAPERPAYDETEIVKSTGSA